MRSGTLILVIAANAVIAVGVVAVALTAFPPAPDAAPAAAASRAPAEQAQLLGQVQELRTRVEGQEGVIRQLSQDLVDSKRKMADLEQKVEAARTAAAADAAAGSPAPADPAEAANREAMRAMGRGMAMASRQMGRRILESLANPTEETVRQAEQRARGEAQRLGGALKLSPERVAQVEQAFLDVDRRIREKMRVAIQDKGIDNVTYEDAKPLVDESFTEREKAVESILTPEEMEGFRTQEQQARTFVDMGMRLAFPPATPTEGQGR